MVSTRDPLPAAALRIAVAMPNRLVRAELCETLGGRDGVLVVRAAATLGELRAAGFGAADAGIVDAEAIDPDDEPLGAGDPHVVVLAAAGDERIGEWLIDGVSVLPPTASLDAVVAALQAAQVGLVATPAAFAADALRYERIGGAAPPPAGPSLTRREREVLARMSQGLRNREIGDVLGISAHTAKFHVAQIIAKLDAQSRAHAVAKALRAGLVDV